MELSGRTPNTVPSATTSERKKLVLVVDGKRLTLDPSLISEDTVGKVLSVTSATEMTIDWVRCHA